MERRIHLRLPLEQLHHHLQPILVLREDLVGSLALDVAHRRAQLARLPLVALIPRDQQTVETEQGDDRDRHRREQAWIAAPELSPTESAAIGARADRVAAPTWVPVFLRRDVGHQRGRRRRAGSMHAAKSKGGAEHIGPVVGMPTRGYISPAERSSFQPRFPASTSYTRTRIDGHHVTSSACRPPRSRWLGLSP